MVAQIVLASVGIALLASAMGADQAWLDRHFLPSFFTPRRTYVLAATIARALGATVGVAFSLVVRSRIGRFVARTPPGTLFADATRMSLASAPALATIELALRRPL